MKTKTWRSAVAAGLTFIGFCMPVCAQTPAAQTPEIPSPITKTFGGREWLMGINTTVREDEGQPVISVRGQAGGFTDRARPIGHVALAKGISLKEGAISFEMKSAELNRVGHNYIGVAFRAQDQLRYEVLYFRFCPGPLAGIQYAVVSDGTDPWQKFQDAQYTRKGVFPNKTWIKIRVELRGDRMLCYMNNESKPTLDVDRLLGGYGAGSVGFWAFPSSGEGIFRNLTVTPGPLPGPEPAKGELSVLVAPTDTPPQPAGAARQGKGQRAPTGQNGQAAPFTLPPLSKEPGTINPAQWALRVMKGTAWEMTSLRPDAVTNGVLRVLGSADKQRIQAIYKTAQLTGDFDLTARYQGNCRIGLVCADNQRGFIGIQNTLSRPGELRVRRISNKLEFTLDGQPVTYTKALTTEDRPFYFGLVLDDGMGGQVWDLKVKTSGQ